MRKLHLDAVTSAMWSATFASLLLVGCAAEDSAVPPGGSGTGVGVGGSGGGEEGPCATDGEKRECSVHNAYGCLAGTQTCEAGTWSDCAVGSMETEDRILLPSGDGPRPSLPSDTKAGGQGHDEGRVGHPDGVVNRAVGDPCTSSATCDAAAGEYCGGPAGAATCRVAVECGDDGTTANPCDPACHVLDPTPADFSGPGAPYGSGSFNNYPSAFVNAGLPNNCDEDPFDASDGPDCQFDHYCAPNGNGECLPWGVGGTDPGCVGEVNLTVGLPCADGIPVCNRGTVAVTKDFHLDHDSSAGVSDINSGDPNLGGGDNCEYEFDDRGPLLPGTCVMVPFDCWTPGDTDDDLLPGELITAHGIDSDECNTGDNFGYYAPGAASAACGVPSCGGGVTVGESVQLSMFAYVDRSGSMSWDVGGGVNEKLNTVCRGLRTFVQDPANADIQFEYKEWPDGNASGFGCSRADACAGTIPVIGQGCFGPGPRGTYSALDVMTNFDILDACNFPGVGYATFDSGVAGISSGTPLLYTLRGALYVAGLEKAANPERAVVVVLVTDALEIGGTHPCPSGDAENNLPTIRTELQAAAAAGVYTAVVGIGISNDVGPAAQQPLGSSDYEDWDQANDIASWGGTDEAIFLSGGGDPTALTNALNEIRNGFACSRTIPNPLPSGVTMSDIEVAFNDGGTSEVIARVAGTDDTNCDATPAPGQYEYYFDGIDTITLCPETCEDVSAAGVTSNFEVQVPCAPGVVPVTGGDTFSVPVGTCPNGTIPKWTQMIVNGSFPGGSTISVEAHTLIDAADLASYPSLEWVPIATLPASNPVDLFTPLDGFNNPPAPERDPALTPPQGYGEFIEFRFNSTPGSVCGGMPVVCSPAAPTLTSYEVQFTCEATE